MSKKPRLPRLPASDLKILQILLSSSGKLEVFTIYRRSRLPFNHFLQRYMILVQSKSIIEEDGVARLSGEGEELVRLQLSRVNAIKKSWREVPAKYLGDRLADGAFYIPNLDLLCRRSFNVRKERV